MASSQMGPHNGNVEPPQKLHICIQNWPIYRLNLASHRSWFRASPKWLLHKWQCSATTWAHPTCGPHPQVTQQHQHSMPSLALLVEDIEGGRGHRTLQNSQLSLTIWTCCLMWILAFTSMIIPKPNVPIPTRSTKWKNIVVEEEELLWSSFTHLAKCY